LSLKSSSVAVGLSPTFRAHFEEEREEREREEEEREGSRTS
jgi:hypothetical protein